MEKVCPRCRGTTPDLLCPRCGIRTTTTDSEAAAIENESLAAGSWLVGLILAQGLYYSLWHLVSAGLLAHGSEAAETSFWNEEFAGLITAQGLQAVALFSGAMLAAAGRKRGLMIGAVLGLVNALLLFGLPVLLRRPTDESIWFVQPFLHAFVGAVGGAVGCRVWQPAPQLPPLTGDGRVGREVLTTVLPERPTEVVVESVPWLHILAGVVVAVGGTIGARMIRDAVVFAGGGKGREMAQSIFITWEITLIAQIIGGAIAGAGTRGGATYGFCVGLPAAIILAVVQAAAAVRVPTPTVPAWLLGLSVTEGSGAAIAIQAGQALILGALGGWLGSLVLPADPGYRPAKNR
jgi:hypothetical protein